LEVDLATSERLIMNKKAGQRFVAESGLTAPEELRRLGAQGFDAFLIGEHFMRSPDPGSALDRMRGIQ
jgi:indole-3-glycerol phosphate synthase